MGYKVDLYEYEAAHMEVNKFWSWALKLWKPLIIWIFLQHTITLYHLILEAEVDGKKGLNVYLYK